MVTKQARRMVAVALIALGIFGAELGCCRKDATTRTTRTTYAASK